MIKFFPELRRPRSDGLASALGLEDYRDPFEIHFGLFGDDDGGGSGGLSDEDIDQDVQQDIAAASVGLSADNFGYSAGFDPGNLSADQQTAVDASRSISEGAAQGQAGVDAAQAAANASPSVSQAVANLSGMTVNGYAPGQTQAQAQKQAIDRAFLTSKRTGRPVTTKSGYVTRGYDPVTGRAPTAAEKTAIQAAGIQALAEQEAATSAASTAAATSSKGTPASDVTEVTDPVTGITSLSNVPDQFTAPALSNVGKTTSTAINADQILGMPSELSAPSKSVSSIDTTLDRLAASNKAALADMTPAEQVARAGLMAANMDLDTPRGPSASQVENFTERDLVTDVAPETIGITSSPSVSAADVLAGSLDISNPNEMAAAERAASVSAPASNVVSDFSPTPAGQLAEVYGIDLDALNAAVDDPNAAMGARGPTATDAKAGIGYDPVTDMPYGLEFATNPQTGAQITTNLAGLTREQEKNQPLSMDIAQFIGSNPYGYEIDPVTGQVIGQVGTPGFGILGSLTTGLQNLFMGPPQTTEDLIERGAYTGMTGQDGDGMTGGDGVDSVAQQPTTDPCPEGYALVDGACTPVSPEEEAAYKFGTNTGVKYFDPFTQATQLGGANPFVLQPYMPGQNPFAQPSQAPAPAPTGIQAISPTGAALGRQI